MEVIKDYRDFTIFDWWKKVVFENYNNFEGRATRKEYWYFQLINMMVMFPIGILSGMMRQGESTIPLMLTLGFVLLMALALFIPNIAVSIRRLHDTNKSGWWIFIGMIPYVGGIIAIVLYAIDGTKGENEYGEDPKGRVATEK